MAQTKSQRRLRARRVIRNRLSGTPERPRLTVYRSNANIYAQVVDDLSGRTLAAANSLQDGVEGKNPKEIGRAVGLKLAEAAKAAGIGSVVFDRNGYRYHGRVKALADGAREGGLTF